VTWFTGNGELKDEDEMRSKLGCDSNSTTVRKLATQRMKRNEKTRQQVVIYANPSTLSVNQKETVKSGTRRITPKNL
jgi:hypothetical protein